MGAALAPIAASMATQMVGNELFGGDAAGQAVAGQVGKGLEGLFSGSGQGGGGAGSRPYDAMGQAMRIPSMGSSASGGSGASGSSSGGGGLLAALGNAGLSSFSGEIDPRNQFRPLDIVSSGLLRSPTIFG